MVEREPVSNVEQAIIFATAAHAGQLDKSGVPYIYHPLRVMEAVRHLGDSYARVAVLHDVVEDTGTTLEQVRDYEPLILTTAEVLAIKLVTREDGITYREFIQRIADDTHGIARAVKIADIRDNLGRLTPELKGLEKRYGKALEILQ